MRSLPVAVLGKAMTSRIDAPPSIMPTILSIPSANPRYNQSSWGIQMKYRMYCDEVGNSDLNASADPNHRYLSITGIILELEYVEQYVHPELDKLKRKYFKSHPDEPVILHRKDLVNKKPPFQALRNEETCKSFDNAVLSLFSGLDLRVVTVTIDKLEHRGRYTTWQFDPYHYCLMTLVERYVLWLRKQPSKGDIMFESRGGKEDRRLKDSFVRLYEKGTQYVEAFKFHECLTSKELKIRQKQNNIAGLQLADLIAHPSYIRMRCSREHEPLPVNFGQCLIDLLENKEKYIADMGGRIEGWGRKWLP